jgi:TolA-binding protein
VVAQRRLLDTYPGSAKVPDAMLNMASALRDSGDVAGERRMLEQLVSRHPSSEAAEKARKRMAARN